MLSTSFPSLHFSKVFFSLNKTLTPCKSQWSQLWDQSFNTDFFDHKLNNLFFSNSSKSLFLLILENNNLSFSHMSLVNGNNVPFVWFFKKNFIDVPNFFDKTDSLRRSSSRYTLEKLTALFMRKGMKLKLQQLISKLLLKITRTNLPNNTNSISWKTQLFILNNFFISGSTSVVFNKNTHLKTVFGTQLSYNLSVTNTCLVRELLLFLYNLVSPLFSFYIYRVKKKIYKNTRGKSGKYTFLWKYLPPYKRFKLVSYWLSRDLLHQTGFRLSTRLESVLKNFITNTHNSSLYEMKKFSHNYIYRNARTTIGSNYRTVKN